MCDVLLKDNLQFIFRKNIRKYNRMCRCVCTRQHVCRMFEVPTSSSFKQDNGIFPTGSEALRKHLSLRDLVLKAVMNEEHFSHCMDNKSKYYIVTFQKSFLSISFNIYRHLKAATLTKTKQTSHHNSKNNNNMCHLYIYIYIYILYSWLTF